LLAAPVYEASEVAFFFPTGDPKTLAPSCVFTSSLPLFLPFPLPFAAEADEGVELADEGDEPGDTKLDNEVTIFDNPAFPPPLPLDFVAAAATAAA